MMMKDSGGEKGKKKRKNPIWGCSYDLCRILLKPGEI